MPNSPFFSIHPIRGNKASRFLGDLALQEYAHFLDEAYEKMTPKSTSRALVVKAEGSKRIPSKKDRISFLVSSRSSKNRFRRLWDWVRLQRSAFAMVLSQELITRENRKRVVFIPPFLDFPKNSSCEIPSLFQNSSARFRVFLFSEYGEGEDFARNLAKENPDFQLVLFNPLAKEPKKKANFSLLPAKSLDEVLPYAIHSDAILPLPSFSDFPLSAFFAIRFHKPLFLPSNPAYRSFFFDAPCYYAKDQLTPLLRGLAFDEKTQGERIALSQYLDSLYSKPYTERAIETFLAKRRCLAKANPEDLS